MTWIESHVALRNHPKTVKAAHILDVSRYLLIGHLHVLWWWAVEYAQDGDLTGLTNVEIAEAAGWEGEPECFVRALISCGRGEDRPGFLEAGPSSLRLHDWDDYAGKLIERREANAAKQRSWREQRRKEKAITGTLRTTDTKEEPHNRDITVTLPLRDGATVPTVPDLTTISLSKSLSTPHANGKEPEKELLESRSKGEALTTLIDKKIVGMERALAGLYYQGTMPTGKPYADVHQTAIDLVDAGVFPKDVKALREKIHIAFPKYATVQLFNLARYAYLLHEPEPPTPGLPLPSEPEPHGPPASPEEVEARLAEIAAKMGRKRP